MTIGTVLETDYPIVAIDGDPDIAQSIVYTIDSESRYFEIDSITGVIHIERRVPLFAKPINGLIIRVLFYIQSIVTIESFIGNSS
jgi:hypothetical protein